MQLRGRRFDTGEAVEVTTSGERVARVRRLDDSAGAAAELPWIAPGLVDIQVNGYGGQEFSSAELTAERVARILRDHYAFGVTRLCPTLTTESYDVIAHGMRAVREACEQNRQSARQVAGIHLEGPFLSTEEGPRGAHPLAHCRRPDWEAFQRLQEAAGGRIVLVTMSVEFDETVDFVERATRSGVVVAIGHTSANRSQILAAVDAGARLSTHLGNGAHRCLRRHPNYLWDQMAEDRLMASLIVDGHHLPAEVVRTIVRAKSPERCILVSDESGLAGLPPGRYTTSGCELEILEGGKLVIAGQDQLLAGASLPLGAGVANVMRFAGVDLATALAMASAHPAALVGCEVGGLRAGDLADLVLFDLPDVSQPQPGAPLEIRATLAAGETCYEAPH